MLDHNTKIIDGEIHEMQSDAHGQPASRGFYAMSPAGDLVLLAPGQPVKPGWRVADEQDIDASLAKEAERKRIESAPPAPHAEPVHAPDPAAAAAPVTK